MKYIRIIFGLTTFMDSPGYSIKITQPRVVSYKSGPFREQRPTSYRLFFFFLFYVRLKDPFDTAEYFGKRRIYLQIIFV